MTNVFMQPQPVPNEYNALKKDGTVIQILIISRPLLTEEKPSGFRGIILDLTEKKKLEAVLQNTARLESLGILAGGIAHDFNNLLTGIFGYIDLANQESKDELVSRYLSNAFNTINRARALTLQLLTFAKGGAPVKKIAPLFPFIQEAVQFALSGSTATCRFDVSKDIWWCDYDRNQIGQVIDNIVINGQQAMPMGGVIDVKARNLSLGAHKQPALGKGNYVLITIKDSGIGIPREILAHIFDPFFTTKTEGHGLGLATSFSIVRRHGGTIDVTSRPGEGSTFHIYLPAIAASGTAVFPAIAEVPVIHKGSGTVIVMDDEEVIRRTVAAMLKTLGYTVEMKKEGKGTVDCFASRVQDGQMTAAIFLDLTVPGGMGGKETVRHIRAIDEKVPVFVASGYAEDPVMANPVDYGFNASLRKPFTMNELAAVLEKFVSKT